MELEYDNFNGVIDCLLGLTKTTYSINLDGTNYRIVSLYRNGSSLYFRREETPFSPYLLYNFLI